MPEQKNQILLLAQELYGKNPKLFLKDMCDFQEKKEYINCFSLMEYTDLFRCIRTSLFSNKCKCINIYTKKTNIFNFKQHGLKNLCP